MKEESWFTIYDTLLPKQIQFMDTFAIYRLFWWAKWGGKSHAMRAEAVKQCLSVDWLRGLVLRRTYPEVYNNMIVPLQRELPKEMYNYKESKHVMEFPNKSTITFGFCQTLKDVMKYQGIEYDFICIEELTHWTELEFSILMWSLRTSRPDYVPNFFASTNPWWVGHARVKRIWIDRDFKEWEDPSEYAFIPAKVTDNTIIMENDKWYVKRLHLLPEVYRKAYLDWDWDVFAWQYFTEFNRDIHVIEPFIPKDGKRSIVAFDYWYSKPSAVYWMHKDNEWDIYIYRELYKTGLTYKDLWGEIVSLTTPEEHIDTYIWDPAAVNKKSESSWVTLAEEFLNHYWIVVTPWFNSRIPGRLNMREHLKLKDRAWISKPKLYICSNCENLIRTLPQMIYSKRNVEDIDTDLEDHAVDWARYWLCELSMNLASFEGIKQIKQSSSINNNVFIRQETSMRNKSF